MKASVSLRLAVALVVFVPASSLSLKGQESRQPTAPTQTKAAPDKRPQSLEEVQWLQNRILTFEDSAAKIRTTTLLADLVWSKKGSESDARALFQKADELLRFARILKPDEASAVSGPKRDRSALTPGDQQSLKQLLVEKVSRHDIAWGQRLRREYALGPEVVPVDRNQVLTQLRDGLVNDAAGSLHQMIEQNLSGRQALMGFMQLLIQLKAQDPAAADKLFVEESLKMAAQPNSAANDVLILGNYIFAPRYMDPKLFNAPLFLTSQIQLGDVVVQADVAQARPNVSPGIARAYLAAATQSLEQGTSDVEEMQRRSAAAYLLLPHARTLAPELTSRLTNTVERGGVSLREPSKSYHLPRAEDGKLDLKEIEKSIEAISNPEQRDQFILKVVSKLYLASEFDAASSLTERMDDQKAQGQLNSLIAFGRGAKSLESAQPDRISIAQKNLKSVTTTLQRFLLRIGLAQAYLKQQDKVTAATMINGAIDEFGDRADYGPQPYLILSAVELLASADPATATYRMRDAIKAFNALDSSRKGLTTNLTETVKVGSDSATFPLRIAGVKNGSFSSTVKSLSAEPQTLRAILFDLRDERVLSEAMLAYAGALLG